MKSLFVDCPTGLAGDMLLAGFLDLGVPSSVVKDALAGFGLDNTYKINSQESSTFGIRGLKVSVESLEKNFTQRSWKDIRNLISQATFSKVLRNNVLQVFSSLAEAEASVHGQEIEKVHFHEIGSIDSLVDVIGVCACVEYLKPYELICAVPKVGHGTVSTSHGEMPVPVPAVLELVRRHQIEVSFGESFPSGELTTPTGLALMAVLANRFGRPSSANVVSIGIGLGHRKLDRANFLRVCEIENSQNKFCDYKKTGFSWQSLVIQEAWIDDSTPEDVAGLVSQLRIAGAIDVACQQVQMKKGRQGINIVVMVKPELAERLRVIWLSKGVTLGIRERTEGRWILPRRMGGISTKWGFIKAKQVRRPNGSLSLKPEHDDLLRVSNETGESLEEVRQQVLLNAKEFLSEEDWGW